MTKWQRWRMRLRRAAALALAGALLAGCAACGGDDPESSDVADRQGKGRYVESTLAAPGTAWMHALAAQDGQLLALGGNGLFRSADGGENWEAMDLTSPELQRAKETYSLISGCWAEDGGLIFATLTEIEGTMKSAYRYYYLDQEGNQRELPIQLPGDPPEPEGGEDSSPAEDAEEEGDGSGEEVVEGSSTTVTVGDDGTVHYESPSNAPSRMQMAPDGTLMIQDTSNNISQFDLETGEMLHTLHHDMPWDSFVVIGDTLVAAGYDGAELYDMGTWEKKDPDPVLNQFLTGRIPEGEEDLIKLNSNNLNEAFIGQGNIMVFGSDEEDILYICGRNGLYRHPLGGASVEQVIIGSLTTLGDPSYSVRDMFMVEGNAFYTLCNSNEGGAYSILRYDFDPEMDATPANELNAFLLYENNNVRQAISTYQKAHPDVLINMEISQGFMGAATLSDSLRTLNANIMAGEGPDLIFLDGMPADNYMDKGVLADLSDLVDEACQEEELAENIVRAYQREEGLCAVPTSFTVPVIVAPTDVLAKLNSLEDLVAAVEELRAAHPYSEVSTITGMPWPYMALDQLYAVCAPAWLREDGALDKEKLREYLLAAQRIDQAERTGRPEDDTGGNYMVKYGASGSGFLGADILAGTSLMEVGTLREPNGFTCLKTVQEKLEGYGCAPLKGQVGHVFTPEGLVGINAKSEHQEVARDFVRFMLSKEHQQNRLYSLPVNLSALKEQANPNVYKKTSTGIGFYTDDGTEVQIQFRSLALAEEEELVELVSTLDTPALLDQEMRSQVHLQGMDLLDGAIDMDAALEGILRQVNLQLSES